MPESRTAVVFIHGQGEQQPMEGARELARTMWDAAPGERTSRVAPDISLQLPDLGVVTGRSIGHGEADFYEFYWAHLIVGNRAEQAIKFINRILRRPRREAPVNILPIRQWVIRFLEFASLLTILFMLAVSRSIDPDIPHVPASGDRNYSATVAALNFLTENVFWLAMAAFVLAFLFVIANEIRGGIPRKPPPRSIAELHGHGFTLLSFSRALFFGAPLLLLLVVLLVARQSLPVNAGDFRLPILLVSLTASGFALRREMPLSAGVGVVGAVLALIAAALGPLKIVPDENVSDYIRYAWFFAVFAPLWFLVGLSRAVSSPPHKYLGRRVLFTALTAALALALSTFLVNGMTRRYNLLDALMYASGATLIILGLLFLAAFYIVAHEFLAPIMADSARYLSQEPENVKARGRIRRLGLELLDHLHDCGRYQRVVIVAHSLGAIVGYELFGDFWARRCNKLHGRHKLRPRKRHKRRDTALGEVSAARDVLEHNSQLAREKRTGPLTGEECALEREAYREKQWAYGKSLVSGRKSDWLITDFVTIGAPLTHGELLLSESPEHFELRKRNLELPTCPPRSSVSLDDGDLHTDPATLPLTPHHGALFAAVRWTNLYFTVGFPILAGDLIGGPVAPFFGPGVKDIALSHVGTGRVFAHNEYWTTQLRTPDLQREDLPQHLVKLAEAIDLTAQTARSSRPSRKDKPKRK